MANLTAGVYLAGNAFTGCVPPALRAVAHNDIATSGLPTCGPPPEIGTGEHTLTSGTYTFTARIPDLPQVTFDVPAGVQLKVSYLSIGIPTAEGPQSVIGLHLQDSTGTSRLCLNVQRGYECGRLVADSGTTRTRAAAGTPSLGAAFDRIVESASVGAAVPTITLKPYLTRNNIVGETIVVCLESGTAEYHNGVNNGAEKWTDGLRVGPPAGERYIAPYAKVFEVLDASTPCPAETDSDKVDYVEIIGIDPSLGDVYPCGWRDNGEPIEGCFSIHTDSYSEGPHYTFKNSVTIYFNRDRYPPSAGEGRHSLTTEFRNLIGHELGHVLGLRNRGGLPCGSALMGCTKRHLTAISLTALDFEAYATIYKPNLVLPQGPIPYLSTVPGESNMVRFSFSAQNTIAEKRIEIRQGTRSDDGTTIAWHGGDPLHYFEASAASETWDHPLEGSGDHVAFGIFVTTGAYLEDQIRITEELVERVIGFPLVAELVIGFDPSVSLPTPPTPAQKVAPIITDFGISDTQARGTYDWHGTAPRFRVWQLHRFDAMDNGYVEVLPRPPTVDTPPQQIAGATGTVRLGPLGPGTYKLRGRTCQYTRLAPGEPEEPGTGQRVLCGDWSAFSNAVTVREPTEYCTLRTRVRPSGWGTVSPGGTYECGTTVTLTATPNELYFFDHWDPSGPSVTVNSGMTVTAVFGDVCEVMPEVCPQKDEDVEGGGKEQPASP